MPKVKPIPDWSHLSHQQVMALEQLSFAVPIHQTYLTKNLKIRYNTLLSLEIKELIRRQYLRNEDYPTLSGSPFFTLTQEGQRIVRDWHSWNRKLSSTVHDMIYSGDWPNE